MRLLEAIKKLNYRHYLCCLITVGFLLCSYFYFMPTTYRFIQACKDFGHSISYYFVTLFKIDKTVSVSILNIDDISLSLLPITFEEFKQKLEATLVLLVNKANIIEYIKIVITVLYNVLKIGLLLLPVIIAFVVIIKQSLKKPNNDYNKDTKPLKLYKKLANLFIPVSDWIRSFIDFIKDHKGYVVIWFLIWIYNLNLISAIIGFLAYYLYFAVSYDLTSLYKYLVKLLLDLSVLFNTVPVWLWIIAAIVFILVIRRYIGYKRLNHFEMMNRGFINSLSLVTMSVGTMNTGKTTLITDMSLSQEVLFRNKAYELILQNDLKFPYFPWINLENELKKLIEARTIYNLATCKRYMSCMRKAFVEAYEADRVDSSMCYGYDFERYGLFYNDELKVVDLFDVLSNYSQLYFIYIVESSYLVSNYSIRTDSMIFDTGNFPLWNTEFFKRDSRLIKSHSRHAHILDFDALRIGKKLIKDNKNKDSFEFGCYVITEIGKERGNMYDTKELKKSAKETNRLNDMFNYSLKLARHAATVDNFPFIKFFTDDQRPESLGKDARDLVQIIHIIRKNELQLAMPFFFIEELLYFWLFERFVNLYRDYRHSRGDNCLVMYLLKSLSSKFINYYTKIYNIFSYRRLNLELEQGTMTGVTDSKRYYIMSKKIYSKRFSTDCFGEIFTNKSLRSPVGLLDIKEYSSEQASFEEMQEQNSYFISDLMNVKDGDFGNKE